MPQDIRQVVRDELARRGWSNNKLAVALRYKRADGTDVPVATVQDWLSGRTGSINSVDLAIIFAELEIDVVPKHAPEKAKSPAKKRAK